MLLTVDGRQKRWHSAYDVGGHWRRRFNASSGFSGCWHQKQVSKWPWLDLVDLHVIMTHSWLTICVRHWRDDLNQYTSLQITIYERNCNDLSAFENRLRAGLVYAHCTTNPAVEQNKNVKWTESRNQNEAVTQLDVNDFVNVRLVLIMLLGSRR